MDNGRLSRGRTAAYLLALGLLWGFSFVLIRTAVVETGPVLLGFARIWLGAAALLPVVLRRRRPLPLDRVTAVPLVVMALANFALPYLLIPFGELHVTTGQASILNATQPLFTVALGVAIGIRASGRTLAGVVVGFLGATLLAGDAGAGGGNGWFIGAGAVLLASLLYGAAALIIQRRLASFDPVTLTFASLVIAGTMLLPAAAASSPARLLGISPAALGSVLVLGVVCTAVAYLFYMALVTGAGATVASLNTYLFTLFALFWGWLLLGERPGPGTLAGSLLVLGGVALAGTARGEGGREGAVKPGT